ncbi:hypothetical protein [Sinomicrobium weinanense]|uniref:Transglutaminase domain-containing protein n=1 Tax=Sinomicrobium weinanense TaxID=2842200 RepID=A0A926Q645_9FLAO|nr:hypothetical protein [Sinomicrobium weinanense]MBC9798670.1 hypothetical protein [Sinomicrobium weinanense]MBU3126032.1 hypothetical protein [Sinomicrobium weinanense]
MRTLMLFINFHLKYIGILLKLTLIALFYCSCNNYPSEVKRVLSAAGENRQELEKVFNTYKKNPGDSLKLKAAFFLVSHMPGKYGYRSSQLQRYKALFKEIEKIEDYKGLMPPLFMGDSYPEVDSLWNNLSESHRLSPNQALPIVNDIQYIDSKYLIENIEYAFKAWELPWAKHLDFEEFCNYILPYRFKDEPLTRWRPYICDYYSKKIDSLAKLGIKNPEKICNFLNRDLSSWWRYSKIISKYPISMEIEDLFSAKMGSCTHHTQLGLYVMRTFGLPVSHEQIPQYGNRSLGHDFNSLLISENKFLDFEIGNLELGSVVEARHKWNFMIPKIYRQTWSYNKSSLFNQTKNKNDIPPYFKNPFIKDVTHKFIKTTDIELQIDKPYQIYEHVYLCVFDNHDWYAVDWAEINKKKNIAVFTNVGLNIIYMPMVYTERKYIPVGDPIKVDL